MARFLACQLDKINLQTQLLIMISIEFALIISIFIALHTTNFILLKSSLQQNSDLIFKQKSRIIQQNVISWERSYLDKVFFLNGNTLITLHRLYHETRKQVIYRSLIENQNYKMDFAGTTQIPDPVRIINGYGDNDLSYSFFCYTNLSDFENPKTIDEQIGIKIQEQFQSYGQILHSGRIINQFFLQTYVIKEKNYNIYPCLNRRQEIYEFHAEQRDWYIELKRNYDSKLVYNSYNYTFTKPWLRKIIKSILVFTLKKIGLSIVMPLVDKELNLIGGISIIFMGKELVQSIEQSNFGFQVIYLVSDEGIMIMHPYLANENVQYLYIYNETITGFNMTDWLQIQSRTGESSCPIFSQYQSNLTCRYNSLYKQEMIVGIYDFEEFKMTLMMLQSSQEYVQFYRKFQIKLETALQWELINNMLIQAGTYILLSFLIYKITNVLFRPIRFVKAQALNMISKKNFKQKNLSKYTQVFMSKETQEIFKSFELLKNKFDLLSLHKSTQCQVIEKFLFPKKYFKCKFNKEYYTLLENRTLEFYHHEHDGEKEREEFKFIQQIQKILFVVKDSGLQFIVK